MKYKGEDVKFVVKALSLMCDRKASNLVYGLGGAYCDLCIYSKHDCLDLDFISSGININRTVESATQIFEQLEKDDGTKKKR